MLILRESVLTFVPTLILETIVPIHAGKSVLSSCMVILLLDFALIVLEHALLAALL